MTNRRESRAAGRPAGLTGAAGAAVGVGAALRRLAAALVVLLGLVRVFGRVEATGTARPARAGAVHVPLLVTGAVLLAVGLLGLAAFGFAPPSRPGLLALLTTGAVPWVAVLLAGLGLTRLAARHTTSPGRTDTARRPGPWWTGAPSTRHLSS